MNIVPIVAEIIIKLLKITTSSKSIGLLHIVVIVIVATVASFIETNSHNRKLLARLFFGLLFYKRLWSIMTVLMKVKHWGYNITAHRAQFSRKNTRPQHPKGARSLSDKIKKYILCAFNSAFNDIIIDGVPGLMDDSLEEPWGLLVVKEGGEDERVPVLGQEFIIGRAKGNTSIIRCMRA